MLLNSRTSKNAKEFVERKLLNRLRIFIAVFTLLLIAIFLEIYFDYISASTAIGAMMLGMMSGAVFVRRKRIYWEEDTSRVIARMDKIGIGLLIAYVLFMVIRHVFLHRWLHGHYALAFSFSFAAGAMLGRLLSMRAQIRQILKEKNII